jgi:hypothetical protein
MVVVVSPQAAGGHYLFWIAQRELQATIGPFWCWSKMDRSFLALLAFAVASIIGAFAFAALLLMWWAVGSI